MDPAEYSGGHVCPAACISCVRMRRLDNINDCMLINISYFCIQLDICIIFVGFEVNLIPDLKAGVEENEPEFAEMLFTKIKGWISELKGESKKMMDDNSRVIRQLNISMENAKQGLLESVTQAREHPAEPQSDPNPVPVQPQVECPVHVAIVPSLLGQVGFKFKSETSE